jgi:hypothetical protein
LYAIHAQMKANGRRQRSYRKERLRTKHVQEHVEERLREGWSPQQIAGRMKQQNWADRISHEAIYQWIYSQRGDLRQCLAWGRRRRSRPCSSPSETAAHVNKGVACRECHGQVDQMPLISRRETLFMGWCLSCQRHPEQAMGPREAVFTPRPQISTKSIPGCKHAQAGRRAKWNGLRL